MVKATPLNGMHVHMQILPMQVWDMFDECFNEEAEETTATFSFKEWEEMKWIYSL